MMIARKKIHPDKEIEAAIEYAESQGWRYRKAGRSAHTWGRLLCPYKKRNGCTIAIWSTPSNIGLHVNQILQKVKYCPHKDAPYAEAKD